MSATPRRRLLATLAGLFIALVVPATLTTLGGGSGGPSTQISLTGVLLNEALMWGLTLIVLAITLFWERRPLASIGLGKLTTGNLQAGAAMAVLLLVTAALGGAILEALGGKGSTEQQETMVLGLPVWAQLFAAFSAGVTEEILFRGYPIERIGELTGRRWIGAAATVILFGALHAPFWGLVHAIAAGMIGLALTILYLRRRNLWINITAHALFDGLVFIATDVAAQHDLTSKL